MKTLLAILCTLALPAWAGDFQGWYVGAGASYARDAFEQRHFDDMDATSGWDLLAGYRLSPHLAVEGQVETLSAFDTSDGRGSVGTNTYTLQAKVFPCDKTSVQPFLLAGFGLVNNRAEYDHETQSYDTEFPYAIVHSNRDSSTDWTGVLGGGVDFLLGEHWTLETGVRYMLPTGNSHQLDFVTAHGAVIWRF